MSRFPSLSQQQWVFQQTLEITPDYYLHVHDKNPIQESDQAFDLFELGLHSETLNTSSGPLLLISGLFMLTTFTGLIFSFFRGIEDYLLWVLTSSSLTLVCSLLFFLSHKTLLIYHHRHTHQALFAIRVYKRNKAQREIFVKRLNTLLLRLSEYDRQSFYAQQTSKPAPKDGLSYN